MTDTTDDKLANAREQAKAQYSSIVDMVAALESAEDDDAREQAEQTIHEDALSVEVRSWWIAPGSKLEPEEFRIVLCTGGPAVQIHGELDQHGEPSRAWLECQDWFTPWVQVFDVEQETLLTYARCFYFGEGG